MHCRLFLVALALAALPLSAKGQDTAAATPLAKIITVEASESGITRRFFGRVAAKETVDLAFQVGGQIVQFPAVEGQAVAKGGLIAQLDIEPFQLAHDQAQAQADQANRTLERLEQLQGRSVSEVAVEDARTAAELSAIALRNAQRDLEKATLTAPFDALVAVRNTANYATIQGGTPVVRLHDMSELRIEIDVPEILFGSAGENPDIELFVSFPQSPERFPAVPREFNAETSPVGQTFQITLGMAPPEGLVVLPGSSATVDAKVRGLVTPPVIPSSALVTANDGTAQVMVFTPAAEGEGTVALTPIKIAPTTHGAVAVTEGLEPGQQIVASGATLLQDGATVRRFTGF